MLKKRFFFFFFYDTIHEDDIIGALETNLREVGRIINLRKKLSHLIDCTIKIIKNTEEGADELRRLAVTWSLVKATT